MKSLTGQLALVLVFAFNYCNGFVYHSHGIKQQQRDNSRTPKLSSLLSIARKSEDDNGKKWSSISMNIENQI